MRSGSFVLSSRDRRFLVQIRSQGEHLARELTRSHLLLALADAVPVTQIQQVLGVSRMVIWRTRSAYEERGLDYALYDVARSGQPLKYATDQEAEVVALACSQPPEGAARWTIRLLTVAARHRPQLASINRESVRQILKKTSVDLGAKRGGASAGSRPSIGSGWTTSWPSTPSRMIPSNP